MDYYSSNGSPVADALSADPEQRGFLGGQGFIFPATGWYNVTVAGASGGRGLCNPWRGLGAVFRGQMFIEKGMNDTVMVVVGQRGLGPCDVNPRHILCSSAPKNGTEADTCYQQWSMGGGVANATAYEGGTGGGGASMIWTQDSNGHFTIGTPPFMIVGGGGGSSLEISIDNMTLSSNAFWITLRQT